jgi:hypothetical protein
MNQQQLVEAGYQYVCLQHTKKQITLANNDGKSMATILKIAVVTDKLLEGYAFDHGEGENKDIAVYNQV